MKEDEKKKNGSNKGERKEDSKNYGWRRNNKER